MMGPASFLIIIPSNVEVVTLRNVLLRKKEREREGVTEREGRKREKGRKKER